MLQRGTKNVFFWFLLLINLLICISNVVNSTTTHFISACTDDDAVLWEGRIQEVETNDTSSSPGACSILYDWNAVTFYTEIVVTNVSDRAEADNNSLAIQINGGGKRNIIPFKGQFYFINRLLVRVAIETQKSDDSTATTYETIDERVVALDDTSGNFVNITIVDSFQKDGRYLISARKMNQPNLSLVN